MLDPFFDVDERRHVFLLFRRLVAPTLQIFPKILHKCQFLGNFFVLGTRIYSESVKFFRVLAFIANVIHFSE